ncbi:large ribosomal subunit protein mL53 [Onthophagus taurus]|uniref:large ribosomal subunit protein mL53 n=1 Tax=Onthophagus taurus TaxID=166361 RepID=UPI000C1FE1CD|nr:39S ribosomal protein L53, mitochondrial [Onthophagus taurus]
MSIYFSGTFKRSGGIVSAIAKQLKLVNLKPVKRIQIQFDPFHEKAATARDFLHFISSPKVTSTNLDCIIKTTVVCDRSEPQVKIDFTNNKSLRFLANNLTVLEIFQYFNKHLGPLIKIEQESAPVPAVKAKIQKKLKKK